ncbi:hypothetical protein P885DRAFT_56598 [Corynascus similis CBS 632.67]
MGQHPDLWPNEGGNIGQNHVFRKLEDDTVVDRWGSSWEDKWFLITEDGMLANKEYDGTGPSSFESLGCDEAEELSTTESKSAICPFCEAKSVSNVERHCFNCHCRHCRGGHLRRYIRRVAVGVGDLAIVVAGGLATVVILNFNQSLGTCPAIREDHRWPMALPLLKHQTRSLRCPSSSLYVVSILIYSAAGVSQVVREPKYWTESGLVAVLFSIVVGAVYGVRLMVDALVVGGSLSLICCKTIVWLT